MVVHRMAHIWSQRGGVGEKEGTSDLTRTDAPSKLLSRRGYGKFRLWEIY